MLTAIAMREALPVIREGGIDVVVIDAYDPRIGVVELARSIEALPDPPPIVLVSELARRTGDLRAHRRRRVPRQAVRARRDRRRGDAHRAPQRRVHMVEVDEEPTSPNRMLG